MKVERVLKLPRPAKPLEIEIGLVKIEQAADQERVVDGETADFRGALAMAAQQFALRRIEEILLYEVGCALGGFQIRVLVEDLRSACVGADHQSVPRC